MIASNDGCRCGDNEWASSNGGKQYRLTVVVDCYSRFLEKYSNTNYYFKTLLKFIGETQ